MSYSNADILAAVVSEWARPAISQIACEKIGKMQLLQNMQQGLLNSGLVGANYKITSDIQPFMHSAVNNLVQPILRRYFSQIPEESIPALARDIVDKAMQNNSFTILDGLVEFDKDDLEELKELLEKNLPVQDNEGYQVIH